jgi:hypothetical protein
MLDGAVAAGIAISVAGVLAWFSSKRFAQSAREAHITWKKVVMTPPAVNWLFVMLLFFLVGLTKIAEYR